MTQARIILNDDELDNAFSYLESTTFSDFFPAPFEIAALRNKWDKIRDVLNRVDLLGYDVNRLYLMTSPKDKWLARPSHLLHPIDTILYTGLCFRLAPHIQTRKDLYADDVVFSWNYDSSLHGTKNMFKSDWSGFRDRTRELIDDYSFMGTTDIVDFFPRIYLHRLENSIQDVSKDDKLTRAIMRMLNNWTIDNTSYGIPTGPHASNILGEALLVEVDEFLLSRNIEYIRHDDDFIFFADSVAECHSAIFTLAERLQKTQNLSLNKDKTNVLDTDDYHVGSGGVRERIIEEVMDGDPYSDVEWDDLSDKEKTAITDIDPVSVLDQELSKDLCDQKTMRVILRVLAANPVEAITERLLSNLDVLLPVSDDIARFLLAVQKMGISILPDLGKHILDYLLNDEFVPEFQAVWLLEPFSNSSAWNNLSQLREIASSNQPLFVRRQAILGIGTIGDRSALLDLKNEVSRVVDWEYWALLYAMRKLPDDEFNHLIRRELNRGENRNPWSLRNAVNKAVLHYLKRY